MYAAVDLTAEGSTSSPDAAGSGAPLECRPLVGVGLIDALAARGYLAQIRNGSCLVGAALQSVRREIPLHLRVLLL